MMIQVVLSEEERGILGEILESDLSDLRMEIASTDRTDFREMLKTRKEVLKKVLQALQVAAG